MERLPSPNLFTPCRRGGVILLLESVGWDLKQLTPEQIAKIRELYFLDSNCSIDQLVRDGAIQP